MQLIHIIVDRIGEHVVFNLVEEMPADRTHLHSRIDADLILEFLHEAQRLSKLSNESTGVSGSKNRLLWELRNLGEAFYRQLFPESLQSYLKTVGNTAIFFHVDRAMQMIPWEILHDGSGFLLDRFHIGVNIEGHWRPVHRNSREKLRVLIVADPSENLPWAREEGEQLYESLIAEVSPDRIDLQFLAGRRASKLRLLGAIQERDVIHYAGHAVFDPAVPEENGWLLFDGRVLHARELQKISRAPLLVFANSCLSAPLNGEGLEARPQSDLAGAFLHAGIGNYIGTHWEILDNRNAAAFALDFYRSIFEENTTGKALTEARLEARRRSSANELSWASYVLYGNPLLRIYHSEHRQSFDASRMSGHIERILHSYPLPIARVYAAFLEKEKSASSSPAEKMHLLCSVLKNTLILGGAIVFANPAVVASKGEDSFGMGKGDLKHWVRSIYDVLKELASLERSLTVPRIQSAFLTHESSIRKMLSWKSEAAALPDSSEELASYLVGMQFHMDNFLRDLFGSSQSLLLLPRVESAKKSALLLNGEEPHRFFEGDLGFLSSKARELLFAWEGELVYYHKGEDVLYSLHQFAGLHAESLEILWPDFG